MFETIKRLMMITGEITRIKLPTDHERLVLAASLEEWMRQRWPVTNATRVSVVETPPEWVKRPPLPDDVGAVSYTLVLEIVPARYGELNAYIKAAYDSQRDHLYLYSLSDAESVYDLPRQEDDD